MAQVGAIAFEEGYAECMNNFLHVSGLTFVSLCIMDCLTIPNQVLFMIFYSGLPTASHSKEEKWQGRY